VTRHVCHAPVIRKVCAVAFSGMDLPVEKVGGVVKREEGRVGDDNWRMGGTIRPRRLWGLL
jgi:hypothetical protein